VTALARLRLEMLVGEEPRDAIGQLGAAFSGT